MATPATMNVRSFIDEQPFGRYQLFIAMVTFFIIAFDGLDVVVMAFAAPDIIRDWNIPKQQMASVLSAVFFGLAVGALAAGPIADRFGRKIVLTVSVFEFGILTISSAFAPTLGLMIMLRFLTGLGLGAAMPNAATLISEYAPERKRSLVVTIVFCGFTAGATLTGLFAGWGIPKFGWRAVVAAAGVLPVALGLIIALKLPESVMFMTENRKPSRAIARILRRLAPGQAIDPSTVFVLPASVSSPHATYPERPIAVILSSRYLFGSACLFVSYFMSLLATYVTVNWMPLIVKEAGFSLSSAAFVTASLTLGGTVGSILIGWTMDRVRPTQVLMCTFLLGALFMWLIGVAPRTFGFLCSLSFVIGFCMQGSNSGMNALSTRFFPTSARATGLSWMHGFGRIGAILSAFVGATMFSWGWSFAPMFAALAVPLLVCAVAMFVLGFLMIRHAKLDQAHDSRMTSSIEFQKEPDHELKGARP